MFERSQAAKRWCWAIADSLEVPRQAGRARSRLASTSSGQSRLAKWIGPTSRRPRSRPADGSATITVPGPQRRQKTLIGRLVGHEPRLSGGVGLAARVAVDGFQAGLARLLDVEAAGAGGCLGVAGRYRAHDRPDLLQAALHAAGL